jgi:hypothetical protein
LVGGIEAVSGGKMNNVELARKCLERIRDIADRGASSWDPQVVGWALQELSQVLLERTGDNHRYFEPVSAAEIDNLPALYQELDFINGVSEEFTRAARCH